MKVQLALFLVLLGVAISYALPSVDVYGIDGANRLVYFKGDNYYDIKRYELKYLEHGETIRGIAFYGNDLYGFSTGYKGGSRVFKIDYHTYEIKNYYDIKDCSIVGSGFGTDFVPGTYYLRIVSNTGHQWLVDVRNGHCEIKNRVTLYQGEYYKNPKIAGAAYYGSKFYVIDYENDVLAELLSPGYYYYKSIGSLYKYTNVVVGFDIFYYGGQYYAWATLAENETSALYSINLSTGRATFIATLPGSRIGSLAIRY